MSDFAWLFSALFASVMMAQNVEMNRRAGQEGFRLNMWRMALAAVFWLPLAMVQPWVEDFWFYAAAVFSGAALVYGFTVQNNLARKHNGRVAVLHQPIKAILVFLAWAVIDERARHHVLDSPGTALGVVACLIVMVLALMTFRRNDVSWGSFKAIIPVAVLYGMGDIFARVVMEQGHLTELLIVFMFVMSLSSAVFSVVLLPWRPEPKLPLVTPVLLRAGGWAAFGATLSQVCFFIALVIGPNPAYVSMVALLTPVWLLVYHRVMGMKDDASPWAGTIVVLAAIALMACAS